MQNGYPQFEWHLPAKLDPDEAWLKTLAQTFADLGLDAGLVRWSGQLLWQRGWHAFTDIRGFLCPEAYASSSAAEFGPEMTWATTRLIAAYEQREKVAIWGDFDADGLTATAVLWEGLGQFFLPQTQLRYYIPDRFTESHGLSQSGLEALMDWGCRLLVTCDTGSTADRELAWAQAQGMDVIVTDHHTLPQQRPPVVALINPRQLPTNHPLAHLSGVAVAYKLLEALYSELPAVPQQPLESLLDLVAIGLIADLVTLQGDCRQLTQIGLGVLETQAKQRIRPGVTKLLELCKRTGDRPSDVAFGIGPRINAISRIHGDARFGVELLTSRDPAVGENLALEAELANTRRKALQATVLQQVTQQLASLDLSTTGVIVLSDPQWSPGVLGLVASQLAQTYHRPTILLQTETSPQAGKPLMARGSARSINSIDLYELVHGQVHLLSSFGGHPYAAGLTLPAANLPLFTEGINRALRSQLPTSALPAAPPLDIDLEVTVADLGKPLFKALKLLEPYGMGNPVPRLLLRHVQIENVRDSSLRDQRQGKQRYFKVEFEITTPSYATPFPGHWWGHRRHELPPGTYDLVVELDVNTHKKRYEARLIDWRTGTPAPSARSVEPPASMVDYRAAQPQSIQPPALATCPSDWSEFRVPQSTTAPLKLAYSPPHSPAPPEIWQRWLGIAKYLSRTGEARSPQVICEQLAVGEQTLQAGLRSLIDLGYQVHMRTGQLQIIGQPQNIRPENYQHAAAAFIAAIQEEQFRQRYFCEVSLETLQQVLGRAPTGEPPLALDPQSNR